MVISKNIRTIIWDWNGTLLDDIDLCIETINLLLTKRNLPLLDTARYREVFSFPVKDYYAEIGFDFDKEPFEIPAREFIDKYNSEVEHCNLHEGTYEVLKHFHEAGMQQIVLSAMEQAVLERTLKHNNIYHFFDEVSGLDNHYAHSKIDNGKSLIKRMNLDPKNIYLVGDTVHDFEVAEELGCQCVLIANGHQSESRLVETGCKVINDLSEFYSQLAII